MDDWLERAACSSDPDLMTDCSGRYVAVAKRVCYGCPVFDQCRDLVDKLEHDSLDTRNMTGVWAGEDPDDRATRRLVEWEARNGRPRRPAGVHGTAAGYRRHLRRGEPIPPNDACGCRAAWRAETKRVRGKANA